MVWAMGLTALLVRPAATEAETLLKEMQAAYHAAHRAEFDVKFTLTDRQVVAKGTVHCQHEFPDRFRAVVAGIAHAPLTIVGDGHVVFARDANGKTVRNRYSHERLSQLLPSNVETFAFYDDSELSTGHGGAMEGSTLTVGTGSWNSKVWTLLHEVNTADKVSADYYIDPKTHLIWRTVSTDMESNTVFSDCEISSLILDPHFGPDIFKIPI